MPTFPVGPHEQQERRPRWAVYKPSYRATHTPDAESQRQRLEVLRYKWGGYKDGLRFMQRLGDIAREWFPALAGLRSGAGKWIPK